MFLYLIGAQCPAIYLILVSLIGKFHFSMKGMKSCTADGHGSFLSVQTVLRDAS